VTLKSTEKHSRKKHRSTSGATLNFSHGYKPKDIEVEELRTALYPVLLKELHRLPSVSEDQGTQSSFEGDRDKYEVWKLLVYLKNLLVMDHFQSEQQKLAYPVLSA